MKRTKRLLAALLLCGWPAAAAEEIGEVAALSPHVRAFPPAGRPDFELRRKDPIERGTHVRLLDDGSYLLVAFHERFGALPPRDLRGRDTTWVASTARFSGKAEAGFGEDGPGLDARILLTLGRLWLDLLPGKGPLSVLTPQALIHLRGTSVRILVDPDAGTFVAVDEGTVEVADLIGGAPLTVSAGQWVTVPPGGPAGRPSPFEEPDFGRSGKSTGLADPPLPPQCCPLPPPCCQSAQPPPAH